VHIHDIGLQIVTGVEVTTGHCYPEVWEILPDAEGGGHYFPKFGKQFPVSDLVIKIQRCLLLARDSI